MIKILVLLIIFLVSILIISFIDSRKKYENFFTVISTTDDLYSIENLKINIDSLKALGAIIKDKIINFIDFFEKIKDILEQLTGNLQSLITMTIEENLTKVGICLARLHNQKILIEQYDNRYSDITVLLQNYGFIEEFQTEQLIESSLQPIFQTGTELPELLVRDTIIYFENNKMTKEGGREIAGGEIKDIGTIEINTYLRTIVDTLITYKNQLEENDRDENFISKIENIEYNLDNLLVNNLFIDDLDNYKSKLEYIERILENAKNSTVKRRSDYSKFNNLVKNHLKQKCTVNYDIDSKEKLFNYLGASNKNLTWVKTDNNYYTKYPNQTLTGGNSSDNLDEIWYTNLNESFEKCNDMGDDCNGVIQEGLQYFLNRGGIDKLADDDTKNSWVKSFKHPDVKFDMDNDEYMDLLGEDIANSFKESNYNMENANLWYTQSYMDKGKESCNSDKYDHFKYNNKLMKHWFLSANIAQKMCDVTWEPC